MMMNRTIHNLIQNSPEWHAYRATPMQFNASDAPAMLDASPYKKREQLLQEYATGKFEEIDARTQKLFDDGHRFEQEDRPLAEEFLGDELYPATVSVQFEGFRLSASLDGWTMDEETIYEHKTLNKLIRAIPQTGEIPLVYRIQMEQQLLVSGANVCLFCGSNGKDSDETPIRIKYYSDPVLRERIINGWKQFAADLSNYVPIVEVPKAIAEIEESLPALSYKTHMTEKGLALTSNLEEYKAACVAMVERSKKKMETDQDFANAENRIKRCKEQEDFLKVMQTRALSEVSDLDKFSRDLGAIADMLKECRLNEKKQVDARKAEIRQEIINAGKVAFDIHIKTINEAISITNTNFGSIVLPQISTDFAGAISGKKLIKSLQEAVNSELARAKIEANRIAGIIDANLDLLKKTAIDYAFLFSDIRTLIVKDQEDLKAIVINRIAEHKQQEDARIAAEAQKIADKKIADQKAEDLRKQESQKPATSPVKSNFDTRVSITSAGVTNEEQINLFGGAPSVDPMEEYFSGVDPQAVQVNTAESGYKTFTRNELIQAIHHFCKVDLKNAEAELVRVFCYG